MVHESDEEVQETGGIPRGTEQRSNGSAGLSRRATLGMLGAGALGLGATGSVSASGDDDRFEIHDDGPNPMPLVDARGEDLPEEPDDDMELFDAEPEFPPFVDYEGMVEEFCDDAKEYLQPHGAPNLLESRRLVVDPDGEPMTWEAFAGASATATVSSDDDDGSHVEIEFDGLTGDGVYTVWTVHEPGWHRPLGGNDGEKNAFYSDEDGSATLEVVDRPDELTLPPGATEDEETEETVPITEYPLHEIPDEFFFVVAYHYDERTWGPQPGPFWVPQLVIDQFDD